MGWMQALKHTEKFDEMKLEERNNSRMINQHADCVFGVELIGILREHL